MIQHIENGFAQARADELRASLRRIARLRERLNRERAHRDFLANELLRRPIGGGGVTRLLTDLAAGGNTAELDAVIADELSAGPEDNGAPHPFSSMDPFDYEFNGAHVAHAPRAVSY